MRGETGAWNTGFHYSGRAAFLPLPTGNPVGIRGVSLVGEAK